MRLRSAVAVLIAAGLTIGAAASQAADENAVRKLNDDFVAAINKGDAKGAVALFASDGDYLSSTGRLATGAAEIEKMVAAQAAGAFKGLTFKTTITSVRMVKADVAIASGTFQSATRNGHSTIVAVRDGGRWRIAAMRAMVPAK